MVDQFATIQLPFPDSNVTHTIFYRAYSGLEIEIFNLPLYSDDEELISLLKNAFSVFGKVADVKLENKTAILQFQSADRWEHAMSQQPKHEKKPPPPIAGHFGVERYINQYQEHHPDQEILEKFSSDIIAEFEEKERKMKEVQGSSRHVARLTQAEVNALMKKHQERMQKMQSTDFYAFQQRGKKNLFLDNSNEPEPPRHLKKKPKKKSPISNKKE